jgi:hypothetical protein
MACQISDEAMTQCKDHFKELQKASEVFRNKTVPKVNTAFETKFAAINDMRSKLSCMACDPRMANAYNIPAKNVRIERDQYKEFAQNVIEYHL